MEKAAADAAALGHGGELREVAAVLVEHARIRAAYRAARRARLGLSAEIGVSEHCHNVGVDIEKKIQEEIQKQKKVNIEKVLGEIAELDYVLPKQYNQEFTMTRYFHYEYKKLEQFLALKKAEYLFEEKKAEMAVEVFCRQNQMDFTEKIRKIENVDDVTLIQYNGEYHG